ncbi:hypothetical protein SAMN05421820_103129 [Pedobacter steynii]|uniref:Uncharacterized protein n=1 Tax=Pedobacter steynii TaxID=430522 RepID=A0A1G9R562_9SPHI|nr:DUF6266 family protein [Pedobacter steynii]NQX37870.1 hypothetical protein [Pedobacter steynii]SDM18419.1 hypothetical protein SAMN05421820_103129 [Pedobacter steynii]
MGTYKPGIFGPFNGTVGHVVATKWKGKDVVKNSPEKTNKQASLSQVDQRSRFKLVNDFLGDCSGFIAVGYRAVGKKRIPINVALAYHLENAVTGVYPKYELDYAKVKLSLHKAIDPVVKPEFLLEKDGVLKVSWQMPRMRSVTTKSDDLAYIICYNPMKRKFLEFLETRRSDLSATLAMPEFYKGDALLCWIFFVSADGKFTSDTQYLGSVI